MSGYDRIDLRRIIHVEGVERSYAFTASAFTGPYASVVNADPVEILALTRDLPGYKREPVGSNLSEYRFERMLAQDSECPVVMPSIGVPYRSDEKASLYDADLVTRLIEKGVQKMPFCLQGLDEDIERFVSLCKSADRPLPLDEVYRPHFEPEELANVDPKEFTLAFSMEEMINSIDARYNQYMSKYKFNQQNDDYSVIPSCRDALDVLIATGCQYTTPERYWDGESILINMQDYMEAQKRQIGGENPPAIELIDRFALLHERKMAKDNSATATYLNVIESTAENALARLTSHLAGMIVANPEAGVLAGSELSPAAQTYLRSLRHEDVHELDRSRPAATPA